MNFLEKIRQKPVWVRKIILWSVVIIVGILLAVLWVKLFYGKIKEFSKQELMEELNIPSLQEEIKKVPGFEPPAMSEEQLKKLEEFRKLIEEESIKSQELQFGTEEPVGGEEAIINNQEQNE